MPYFTFESIGVEARINCSCCGTAMDCQRKKPRTGLCGHSICEQCYIANYIGIQGLRSPGEFYRCCAPLCDERGFKMGHPTSSSIMIAISLLEQLKWAVNRHLIRIHDKYKASDIMSLQHELQAAKDEIKAKNTKLFSAEQENRLLENDIRIARKELDDTKKKMANELENKEQELTDEKIGKEIAEDALVGTKVYIKGVKKRLLGIQLPETQEGLSPPGTLSQEMKELEARLLQQKKREYNSDTDSSIDSL